MSDIGGRGGRLAKLRMKKKITGLPNEETTGWIGSSNIDNCIFFTLKDYPTFSLLFFSYFLPDDATHKNSS